MNTTALAVAVIISIFIGWIIRRYLIDSMSNLHIAQEATDYLKRDSVNITTMIDNYLFTNISVIPKPKDDDDDNNLNADNVDYSNDNDVDDSSNDSDGGGSDGD